jgi:crotonobetainyl-CoA:carnitine CoA-transferase CaiB-like acyl-CoA transferase
MAAVALCERAHPTTPVTVRVDRGQVSAAVLSERYFRASGRPDPVGFAPLSRFWRTADGWVRTHANYPWHHAALLAAVGTPDDPELMEAALSELAGSVVEDRVVAAGGVAAAVRSVDEWRAHPQGIALAAEPLIGHRSLGDAPPRPHGGGPLPAAGVRVLDLTRVIAGPVCTRYLGALGADVLRIDRPAYPDMQPGAVADTLLAKRSAGLDLIDRDALAVFHDLVDRADVVVCGYRPGSLGRFGLGADQLAERHPGLAVVYLAAWGHSGPWARRRGFDSVVQAPTGIAWRESADGVTPGVLPCQLLDHGTGYLAAAAALDGLRRQTVQGGTHVRQLSLARTASWLTATETQPDMRGDRRDLSRWLVEIDDGDGTVSTVTPPGALDDQPLEWPGPPSKYRTDPPTWTT